MARSIFSRMLLTYLTITLLVIASLSMVIASIYKQNAFEKERQNLAAVAGQVGSLTQDLYNQKINQDQLKTAVDAMASSSGAMIYVLKIDPADLAYAQGLQLNGLQDAFVAEALQEVMEGSTVFKQTQYSQDFNTYVLFIGYPLNINGHTEGAVLLLRPISSINADIARMNLTIWSIALATLLLSIPFIYWNSRRISKPITDMGAAARQIAAGEETEYKVSDASTEIVQLAESFGYMQEQLQKTENSRREFIANVSHELRTPLTSINGFVQAILDGVVKPEQQGEYLQIVKGETNRLISLTADLLQLAKMQSDNLVLNPQALSLAGVVEEVMASQALAASHKNISWHTQIDAGLKVWADAAALKQVLINIVNNAIKYTPEGGEISLVAQPVGQMLEVKVEDNGVGITAADLPYIFEKFYRADRIRSSEDQSTGLGLAIAKNLVQLQGGKIRAESAAGQGTAVIFTLPAAAP